MKKTKRMTRKEKIAEITKWLFLNDRQYESSTDWKKALIRKIGTLL